MSTLRAVQKEFFTFAGDLLSDAVVISPGEHARIGRAYLELPAYDALAVHAWHAMANEVRQQWARLESLGFTMTVCDDNPYGIARPMFHDVEVNRHIAVLGTHVTRHHPVWSDHENDLFRAVHDVLGHFVSQRGFDRHGEEAAYLRHRSTFTPFARQALATETRGQNAAMVLTEQFPEERIAFLPEWAQDRYALTPQGPAEWRQAHSHSARCEIPAIGARCHGHSHLAAVTATW